MFGGSKSLGGGSVPARSTLPLGGASIATSNKTPTRDQGIFGNLWAWLGGLFGFGRQPEQDVADQSIIPPTGIAASPEIPIAPIVYPSGNQKTKWRVTGISNQDGRGLPDPRIFGTVKLYPVRATRVITETRGGSQYMSCIFNLGYGPLDISDIRIGEKPIAEYEDVEYEVRSGEVGDAPFTLVTTDIEQLDLTEILLYNKPIVKLADQNAVRLAVELVWPNGLYKKETDPETGEEYTSNRSSQVKVEYRLSGATSWTNGGTVTKSGNTTEPLYASKIIKNLPKGVYEVQLTNQTQNEAGAIQTVQWLQLRAYGDTVPINPRYDAAGNLIPMAGIALTIKSQEALNGNIESLSCLAKSKLQHWNGASWDAAAISNNNADVFAEMVAGPWSAEPADRVTEIHTESLAEWSDFCLAKGFSFNYVYDTQVELMEALNQVCAVGLASPALIDGKWGVVIDNAKPQAAQLFTSANIIAGSFEGQATWVEDVDAIDIQFVSPDDKWQQSQRPVFKDGKDSTNSYRRQTVAVVGCTDKDQAWKLGRTYLAIAELRREKFIFGVDFEYLRCRRGDLVYFNHDVPQIGIGGSRVQSVQTNGSNDITGLTFLDEFPTDAGTEYDVTVRMVDGTMISRTVIGDNSQKANFVFTEVIPAATLMKPQAGDLVAFGGYLECKVENIETSDNLTARITLVPNAPDVYTADTGTIPEYVPLIVEVEDYVTVVPPPQFLSIISDESVLYRDTDGSLKTRIQITMRTPPANIIFFEYQIRKQDTDDWLSAHIVPSESTVFYVEGVSDGDIVDIRVRSKSNIGGASAYTVELGHVVIGKTSPPPDIPVVELDPYLKVLRFFYDIRFGVNRPLDYAGIQVRAQRGANGNPSDPLYYESAEILTKLCTDDQFDISAWAAGVVTFMVKAVDTSGLQSLKPYVIVADFGALEIANFVETYPLGPTYADCTITNGTVSGGAIHSDQYGLGNAGPFFDGSDSDPARHVGPEGDLYWDETHKPLTVEWQYAPPVVNNTAAVLKLRDSIVAEIYQIYYRKPLDVLFWGDPNALDTTPFPGNQTPDTDLFWDPDAPWSPWLPMPPAGIPFIRQGYQFKVECAGSKLESVISELTMIIDAPTIEVNVIDQIIDAGTGSRISISPITQLSSIFPVVVPDANYPDAFFARAEDFDGVNGPLIKCYDLAGNAVAGKVSVLVKGYKR